MIKHFFQGLYISGGISLMTLMSSCSLVYDDLPECKEYRLPLTYTMNMSYGDGLPRQIEGVRIYAADPAGKEVYVSDHDIESLGECDFAPVLDLPGGRYDILVWGYGRSPVENPVSFEIEKGENEEVSSLSARLPLSDKGGREVSDRDIVPWFHGWYSGMDFPAGSGKIFLPAVDLTKDTNVISVLLQTADGSSLSEDEFSFSISGDNSLLSYRNDVMPSSPFLYLPWKQQSVSAEFSDEEMQSGEGIGNGVLAEMTTGRLTTDCYPVLTVTRNSDRTDIIRINLVRYLLMVKGEYYKSMSDQEYLDRNDSYSLMFFLDSDKAWNQTIGIYINGWRIVPPQSGGI